jgi:hypothetical protein
MEPKEIDIFDVELYEVHSAQNTIMGFRNENF